MAGSYGSNGSKRSAPKTARDMILSLGLIVLAAGGIWLFIPHDDKAPDIKRVDYQVELLTARRAASYPIAAPQGLPKTWKATSVRFDGADSDAWHLGFQAPDGQYVAVEQSAQTSAEFVDDASQGSTASGADETIDGRTWKRYTGGRYDALVLKEKNATTVVAGTGTFKQLTTMAAALRTK